MKHFFLFLLIGSLFGSQQRLQASTTNLLIRATSDMALGGFWQFLTDPDSPYGGWYFSVATSQVSTGTFNLGQTFVPGSYAAFIKGIDYDMYSDLHVEFGGSTVTNYTSDRDDSRWSTRMLFTTLTNTSTFKVTYSNEVAILGWKQRFHYLLISSDTNTSVLASDHYLRLKYPAEIENDDGQDNKNWIPNGSFEVVRRGFALNGNSRVQGWQELPDNTTSRFGKSSYKIVNTNGQLSEVIYKAVYVKPNRVYTLGTWVKSTQSSNVVGLVVTNSNSTPLGFTPTALSTNKTFYVGTNWVWCELKFRVPAYPYPEINCLINFTGISGGSTIRTTNHIDGVVLTDSSSPSNYVAEARLELGFRPTTPGNFYFTDGAVDVPLLIANSTSNTLSGNIKVAAHDTYGVQVYNGSLPYSIAGNDTNYVMVTLPSVAGNYRITAMEPIYGGEPDEVQVTVTYRPRNIPQSDSKFGIHTDFTPFQFQIWTNVGITHIRAMSPGAYGRWSYAQPSLNTFVYADAEFNLAKDCGFKILLNLTQYPASWAQRAFFRLQSTSGTFLPGETITSGAIAGGAAVVFASTNNTGPGLMISNTTGGTWTSLLTVTGSTSGATGTIISNSVKYGTIALDMWRGYTSNLVKHYFGILGTNLMIECGNETDQDKSYMAGGSDYGLISEFNKQTILGVLDVTNTVPIWALGGAFDTNGVQTVLANLQSAGLLQYCTLASCHWYPGNEGVALGVIRMVSNNFSGLRLAGSESGAYSRGGYISYGFSGRTEGTPIEEFKSAESFYLGLMHVPASVARNAVQVLGDGATQFYYYDGRRGGLNPNDWRNTLTSLEHDDIPDPKMAVYVTLMHFLEGRTSLGRSLTNSQVLSWTWADNYGNESVIAIQSATHTNLYKVTLPGGFPPYVRYNAFGTPLGTNESEFEVSYAPAYLVSTNVATAFRTNFMASTLALTTDVTAPNVWVTRVPSGEQYIDSPHTVISYLARDNIGKPEPGNEASIRLQYSSQLTPIDSDFGPWTQFTKREFFEPLPRGSYTLTVRAKDLSNNTNTTSTTFWIGAAIDASGIATAGNVRATNMVVRQ